MKQNADFDGSELPAKDLIWNMWSLMLLKSLIVGDDVGDIP